MTSVDELRLRALPVLDVFSLQFYTMQQYVLVSNMSLVPAHEFDLKSLNN